MAAGAGMGGVTETHTTTTTTTTSSPPRGSGGVLWLIIWLVLLILVLMFVSGFTAWLYIVIIPFSTCFPPLAYVTDFLLLVTQLPYYCAYNMMQQNTLAQAMPLFGNAKPPTVHSLA
ncbi:uncharacterized protein LOC108664406 [Hyalella azteca]|nr:uncharacterized protein LOC108664406 [Hyalella azteca]